MPAISTSFNRFLCLFLLWSPAISAAGDSLPSLTNSDLQWLGERIFASECNSRFVCLTSWNEGEAFPSLGIGHFIWYRHGQQEVFEETFPALLDSLEQSGAQFPAWIAQMPEPESPWQSREQFLAEIDSTRTAELRQFLADTQALQVGFIVQRLQLLRHDLFTSQDADINTELQKRFFAVANSSPPYGIYALIDYLHFKGSGLNPAERYADTGWGLLQVLQAMQGYELTSFVTAAEAVLADRVRNAPIARNEQRWLNGWHNRVRGYLPLNR